MKPGYPLAIVVVERLAAVPACSVSRQCIRLFPSIGSKRVKPLVVFYRGNSTGMQNHVVQRSHSTLETQKSVDAVIVGLCDTRSTPLDLLGPAVVTVQLQQCRHCFECYSKPSNIRMQCHFTIVAGQSE